MILNDLFPTPSAFRECVPGLPAQFSMSDLNSSAISAKKMIVKDLTLTIYEKIIKDGTEDLLESLRVAIANACMYKHAIFDALRTRIEGKEVYKYELEAMRRQYIDNYFNAMDSLIAAVQDAEGYGWTETPYGKLIGSLQIKTTEDFDAYYPIDLSYLFFYRCVPIQRELLLDPVGSYFERIKTREADFAVRLKIALAMLTVSVAIERFDIIELPPSIRNLFDESKASRAGADENSRLRSLAGSLLQKATDTLKNIDLALQEPVSDVMLEMPQFTEMDKIYMMP